MSKEFWIVVGIGAVFVLLMWAINKSTKGFTCPSGASCSQPATVNASGTSYGNLT